MHYSMSWRRWVLYFPSDCTMWHLGFYGEMWVYVLTVDTTCSSRALWLASEVMLHLGDGGVGRLVVDSGSWVIGFEARGTILLAIRLSVWIAGVYIYSWSVSKWKDLDVNWDVNSCCNKTGIMLDSWLVWLNGVRRTRSPKPESEAGVRSPTILVNIELTIL